MKENNVDDEKISITKTEYQYLLTYVTKFNILKGILEKVNDIDSKKIKMFLEMIENI